MGFLKQLFNTFEKKVWLKRWYLAGRMKATGLTLRLDLAQPNQVKALAELTFRAGAAAKKMVCLIGNVDVKSASVRGQPVKARANPPFLVLTFPKKLSTTSDTPVQVRYQYTPDQYGTILQPTTRENCSEKVFLTCRRPLLAVTQGKLVKGDEKPPHRIYEWAPPRSRKLNAIVANVKSFKKATPDGTAIWLHINEGDSHKAPPILDLCVEIYQEATESNRRKLPYEDYHFVESDERVMEPFSSMGLVVVPHGTFSTDDKPTIYGVLAPQLNREWSRDPNRVVV